MMQWWIGGSLTDGPVGRMTNDPAVVAVFHLRHTPHVRGEDSHCENVITPPGMETASLLQPPRDYAPGAADSRCLQQSS